MYFLSDNFQNLYSQVVTNVWKKGKTSGAGDTRELRNITMVLTNPMDRMVWIEHRKPNYTFAMQFFLWLLNGRNDIAPLVALNKNAIKYANPECGTLSTAYGPRIMGQIEGVIKELLARPSTRRAVVSILFPSDNDMLESKAKEENNEEYPCTDHFVFYIEDWDSDSPCLSMTTVMRSNNMLDTVIYDVFAFTMFQEYVLRRLKEEIPEISMGTYTHFVHSAHIYMRDSEKVARIITPEKDKIHLPLLFNGEEVGSVK